MEGVWTLLFSFLHSLHIDKDHKAPPESSDQEHGDVHAVYEDLVQDAEVQPAMSQEQQDDREFVLEAQDDADTHILEAQKHGERHPQERREQAAAEVEEEAQEAVAPAWPQVEVEVAVVGAQQLGGACRDAGRVHAHAVGAVEGVRPPRDGDHGHEWTGRAARRASSGTGRRLMGRWHGSVTGCGVRLDVPCSVSGRVLVVLMSAAFLSGSFPFPLKFCINRCLLDTRQELKNSKPMFTLAPVWSVTHPPTHTHNLCSFLPGVIFYPNVFKRIWLPS